MTAVTAACLAGLGAAALLCLARLARPGALADRVVALETLLVVGVGAVVVIAVRTGWAVVLDVLVVAALVAFVGSVVVAAALERER